MSALITPAQSRFFYEQRGLVLGEQDDTGDCCTHCEGLTPADELTVLDGQDVCLPCLYALTGDDPYAPDNARDL
jgi:formylmethanofuran dehydrogenase subunit E